MSEPETWMEPEAAEEDVAAAVLVAVADAEEDILVRAPPRVSDYNGGEGGRRVVRCRLCRGRAAG